MAPGLELFQFFPQVIESLSDSTIYMAYYSIAHLLQGGVLSGLKKGSDAPGTEGFMPPGPLRVRVEELTDEVFDYIFDRRDDYPETTLSKEVLDELRGEFQFWYPVDIRVSGKDLIQNHLTMSLFNHAAIWKGRAGICFEGTFFETVENDSVPTILDWVV